MNGNVGRRSVAVAAISGQKGGITRIFNRVNHKSPKLATWRRIFLSLTILFCSERTVQSDHFSSSSLRDIHVFPYFVTPKSSHHARRYFRDLCELPSCQSFGVEPPAR